MGSPPATLADPQQLVQQNKMDAEANRIILEGVKDHIITCPKGRHLRLCGLYQGLSEDKKLVLRDKLKNIKMTEFVFVVSYLTKFT